MSRRTGEVALDVLVAEHPSQVTSVGADDRHRQARDIGLRPKRFDILAEPRQHEVVGGVHERAQPTTTAPS